MSSDLFTNPDYLRHEQYASPANLNTRIQLHERFSTNPVGWYNWLFAQFQLPNRSKILEVGCGSGSLWPSNADRVPARWDIYLSDFSPGMIRSTRRALENCQKFQKFLCANVQNIPFPDATFEAVIANHMLYHVPHRQQALAEIERVLKPGGKLYAATNGMTHLAEIPHLVHRFDPSLVPMVAVLPFSLEQGGRELERFFLSVEMRAYPDSLEVTEAEPLVAYILSMTESARLSLRRLADFQDFLAEEIKREGMIRITKSPGLFIATKK